MDLRPVPPKQTQALEEKATKNRESNNRSSRLIRYGDDGHLRRSRLIAATAIYAAIYVSLILVFSAFSYGQVQLRVANILVGLVPIMGWPAIIGQALGVFIANVESPLGPIDLINVIPSLIFSYLIWKLRDVSVFLGLTLYSIALGISVSFALNYAFGVPLLVTLLYTTIGIFIATAVFGYIFYRAIRKIDVLQRYFEK